MFLWTSQLSFCSSLPFCTGVLCLFECGLYAQYLPSIIYRPQLLTSTRQMVLTWLHWCGQHTTRIAWFSSGWWKGTRTVKKRTATGTQPCTGKYTMQAITHLPVVALHAHQMQLGNSSTLQSRTVLPTVFFEIFVLKIFQKKLFWANKYSGHFFVPKINQLHIMFDYCIFWTWCPSETKIFRK